MAYSLFTCGGFDTGILGGCSMAWFGLFIIIFLTLIINRQCQDGILSGTQFNFITALVVGCGAYFILVTITGAMSWGFLAGIGGMAIGGFVLSQFFGGTESESSY